MTKKISIIGNFAHGTMDYNGQTIKTRILSQELHEQLSDYTIEEVDTYGYKKMPLHLLCGVVASLFRSEHIILMLSRNGRKVLFPIYYYLNKVFHRHIWHNVIGAASYELIQEHPSWIKYMNSFDANWVELEGLSKKLQSSGITNVSVLPNFKALPILEKGQIERSESDTFSFCTFSRVEPLKGIEDAVYAIKKVNEGKDTPIATLDIFGQIEKGYEQWFAKMQNQFPNYIHYKGIVDFNESVSTLKSYYILLFPSRYRTEGFPGTIIDAFASGLPVIASMSCELIKNGETGWTYEGSDADKLLDLIRMSMEKQETVSKMRTNCIDEAYNYLPQTVVRKMLTEMKLL